MTIQTFFEMQRLRMRQVDDSEADRAVRRLRFENAQGDPDGKYTPEEYPVHIPGNYNDPLRAAYRRLRMIYE